MVKGELLRIDVGGRRGRDGAAGADGAGGAHGGGDGGHGWPAGPAERGEDAGHIRVELAPAGGTTVHIAGTEVRRGASRPVETTVDLARPGDVVLLARGGDGGHGGVGGDGGSGGTGRAGSDATRYSRGSDGGPGGDGGNGADGTSGAPGGTGGKVELVVDEDATHLVLVATAAVGGGAGGAAGRNGQGGSGGAGGSGGSSHSWTETEESTDAQGNRQTRTTYHSNPGGSAGRAGSSGRSGHAHLVPGAHGAAGSFAIEVRDRAGAVRRYPRRFDLVLEGLVHQPDDADGIVEPGEPVTVSQVVVRNVGGMPTPRSHPTVVGLGKTSWILPVEGDHLVLDRPLGAGEAVTLPGVLRFTVASHVPHAAGDPLASEDTIRLRAVLPAANRGFGDFEAQRDEALVRFPVRFPVQIAPAVGLPSLAPGEATRLTFTLTNVSRRWMGQGTDRRRRVACRLRLDRSELGDPHLRAFDDAGRPISLDAGHLVEIDELGPGASVDVAITVAMAVDAPAYRAARIVASLELGRPTVPDVLAPVQLREHEVRVAARFAPGAGADLLLVVGARTTRGALDAWTTACADLGATPATWDVSLEGHLDLDAPIAGDGGTLGERFAGGAIVVLDGAIPAPAGATTRPSQLLARADAHAVHARGGRIAFVGGVHDPRAWLLHDEGNAGAADADAGAPATDDRIGRDALALAVGAATAPHVPSTWRFWGGVPSPDDLEEAARDASADFARRAPARHRAVFAWSFAERVLAETLWIRRFALGALRAVRLPDRGRGRFVHAAATEDQLGDPSWILERGPAVVAAVLGPEAKVQRLLALGDATHASARVRAATLADDLAVELAAEVAAAVLRGGPVEDDELPVLGAIAQAASAGTAIDPESAGGAAIVGLAGLGWALGRAHVRLWEWLPPFVLLARRPKLRRLIRRHVDAFLDGAFGREGPVREEAARAARAAQRSIEDLHRSARRGEGYGLGAARFVVDHALARHAAIGLVADESTIPTGVLVLPGETLDDLRRGDHAARAQREGTRRALAGARDALLVPGGVDALVARAREAAVAGERSGDVADLLEEGVLRR